VSGRIEKSWGDVLVAASVHHKSLVDEGAIDEARMQRSVSARIEESKRLTAPRSNGGEGLSNRKAAKVLGVSKDTVRNDLASSSPGNGEKLATRALLSQSDQNDWRTPRKYLEATGEAFENPRAS
jgi:hypothetical protein